MDNNNIPAQYKPLSAWAYFGYELLFSIPIVGFILLIVFALSDDNINRRNFARSYFCIFLVVAIITIVLLVFGIGMGIFTQAVREAASSNYA